MICPSFHQLPSLFQGVAAAVGLLGSVADHMSSARRSRVPTWSFRLSNCRVRWPGRTFVHGTVYAYRTFTTFVVRLGIRSSLPMPL